MVLKPRTQVTPSPWLTHNLRARLVDSIFETHPKSVPPHHPTFLIRVPSPLAWTAAGASSLAFLPQPRSLFPHNSPHTPAKPKSVHAPPLRTAPRQLPPYSAQKSEASEWPRGPRDLPLFFCPSPLTHSAPASQLFPKCQAGPHLGAVALAGPSAWGPPRQISTALAHSVWLCRKASPDHLPLLSTSAALFFFMATPISPYVELHSTAVSELVYRKLHPRCRDSVPGAQ